jgi:ATP-dependent RNA helicase MSS116
LLFSATIPQSVQEIAKNALRPGFQFIDTVGEDTDQTHQHVTQELVVMDLEDQIPSILSVLMREMSVPNFKVIVFFTTARLTGYMARLFQELQFHVLEIHSRKSQAQRTKCSDEFRDGKNLILFSSDVSARGMDYPDITFVLQVGLTEREQYIHRLGRTARAGKGGRGMLLLAPFEERSMTRALSDITLIPVSATSLNMPVMKPLIDGALASVSRDEEFHKAAEQAYGAWLGFYNSNLKKCGWDKPELVVNANTFSRYLGLSEVPFLEKKTVGKMGLKGVPGLRVK